MDNKTWSWSGVYLRTKALKAYRGQQLEIALELANTKHDFTMVLRSSWNRTGDVFVTQS
jgi:hypothetical protein